MPDDHSHLVLSVRDKLARLARKLTARCPELYEDALSSATLGACEAARTFDPSSGNAFWTLAAYHAKFAVSKMLQSQLASVSNEEPMGLMHGASLGGGNNNQNEYSDTESGVDLTDHDAPTADELDNLLDDRRAFTRLLSRLAPSQRRAIELSILYPDDNDTAIASRLGVSQQAVTNAKNNGLTRMRKLAKVYRHG